MAGGSVPRRLTRRAQPPSPQGERHVQHPASHVSALLDGLAWGAVQVVDLTQPLSETTPIIQLPPPFANTPGLSREEISQLRRPRPRLGVVHADDRRARRHPRRRAHPLGDRQGRRRHRLHPGATLVGPACVVDKTAETEAAGDYLLTVADLEAWESENGRVPEVPGCCCAPAGARARMTRTCSSTSARTARGRRVPTWRRRAGWPPSAASPASGPRCVGIDAGAAGGMDPPFPVHNFLLGSGKLGLTQLANLDQLPATGAMGGVPAAPGRWHRQPEPRAGVRGQRLARSDSDADGGPGRGGVARRR